MASLVADYGTSSGSDSESETTTDVTDQTLGTSKKGVNLLESTPAEDTNENDESNEDDDETEPFPGDSQAGGTAGLVRLPNPLADKAEKLPSPALGSARCGEGSVFVNPFRKAEEAKQSILEQHVKMTTTELPAEVGGRKTCWNYRKGRCRLGHRCKYSHGQELQTVGGTAGKGDDWTAPHTTAGSGQGGVPSLQKSAHSQHHGGSNDQVCTDEDGYMAIAQRKKRPGVTDTLLPPRKARRQLDKFRSEERPWTLNK